MVIMAAKRVQCSIPVIAPRKIEENRYDSDRRMTLGITVWEIPLHVISDWENTPP
jgi:hypothetical protein